MACYAEDARTGAAKNTLTDLQIEGATVPLATKGDLGELFDFQLDATFNSSSEAGEFAQVVFGYKEPENPPLSGPLVFSLASSHPTKALASDTSHSPNPAARWVLPEYPWQNETHVGDGLYPPILLAERKTVYQTGYFIGQNDGDESNADSGYKG